MRYSKFNVMEKVTVFEPNQRLKVGFFKTFALIAKDVVNSRELIWQLFRRDFLMGYKKSFIGIAWILIAPIFGIVSWVFMNATGILNPGNVDIPYPAYVLLSSTIWGLFMGFYGSATGTLGAGGGFITQINYPHIVLLAKQLLLQLAGFTIGFFINIAVLLVFGVVPSWYILILPILALPMFFLGSALGLIINLVSIVSTDLSSFWNVIFGFTFYITPIIYSTNTADRFLNTVIQLNPLTYLVGGVRDLIIKGAMEHPERFLFCSVVSFIAFLISVRLFYVSEQKVIERMV